MIPDFLMRSLLFVPAHNDKFLESASKCKADVLLLDLEDSCQPVENKALAREKIKQYLNEGKFNNKIIIPRVNERISGEFLKDIYSLTIPGITGFMYPKAEKAEDVYFLGKLLETIEYEKGYKIGTFKIIPLIESTGAIMELNSICSICPNRVIAVAFGHLDYITDLGGRHDKAENSIFTVRSMIAIAAKANNIVPIDTIHPRALKDLEDLKLRLESGRDLGYEGMLCLNPIELELVNQYYSPSEKDVKWALEIIELSTEAVREGKGVALMNGKFIGPPLIAMAKNILKKNKLIQSPII